jgi:hypothetical protein
VTGGGAAGDDEVPGGRREIAFDDPRVAELHELVGHVGGLAGSTAPRVTPPAPTGTRATPTHRASEADIRDEVDRMEAGLRATARNNSDAGDRSAEHRARRGLIQRWIVALVVVVALTWVADNALGYAYSTSARLPVKAAGRGARVEVAHRRYEQADCWRTGSVEDVWKAAPPFDRLVPYRCGDGVAAILVPGMISVFALATVFFGSLVLLVSWLRRRRGTWY